MADIVFRYDQMRKAATDIEDIRERYKGAASKFETDFINATGSWEGASKDKMVSFVSGPVKEYMDGTVSQILDGLSELLKANADQMESADQQIADNIPTTL